MINALKVSGKAFLVTCLMSPQLSLANEFTSADVLEWEESAQVSFFQTSISMARIVAVQTGQHGDIVRCLNHWYRARVQGERHEYIRAKLEDFPGYHPQGIIMAVLEEACGDFAR